MINLAISINKDRAIALSLSYMRIVLQLRLIEILYLTFPLTSRCPFLTSPKPAISRPSLAKAVFRCFLSMQDSALDLALPPLSDGLCVFRTESFFDAALVKRFFGTNCRYLPIYKSTSLFISGGQQPAKDGSKLKTWPQAGISPLKPMSSSSLLVLLSSFSLQRDRLDVLMF